MRRRLRKNFFFNFWVGRVFGVSYQKFCDSPATIIDIMKMSLTTTTTTTTTTPP